MTKINKQNLPDVRERILNAAERLFMQHGFDGSSISHGDKRGRGQLAAANYHFGSKEALMQEVLRRRLGSSTRNACDA